MGSIAEECHGQQKIKLDGFAGCVVVVSAAGGAIAVLLPPLPPSTTTDLRCHYHWSTPLHALALQSFYLPDADGEGDGFLAGQWRNVSQVEFDAVAAVRVRSRDSSHASITMEVPVA
jgi:hypothetical protein